MERIIIIGSKSSAILIAENIYDAQTRFGVKAEVLGFACDDQLIGTKINGFEVIHNLDGLFEKYENLNDVHFVFQSYDIKDMKAAIQRKNKLGIPDSRYYTFIHPSCMISRSASIGVGSILLAHTVVNPNASLGKFNSVMSGVTIGHDAKIGDYNLIATQAIIANINMGDRNFVGINATTNNKISIGDDCMIGMASNVVHDVPSNTKCFGNPAKVVSTPKRLK
jgi:sugar O-acyltransferase (sialic acid O-acetyltransferase NeuD family)